ncbi:MAG: LPS assembly protein LptD [Thermoanaerobaculia bacterium]
MNRRGALIFLAALIFIPIRANAQTQAQKPPGAPSKSGKFSLALPSAKPGEPVRWTARSQEFVQGDYAILEGEVKVHYQNIVIGADKVTVNLKTKDVTAEGNVVLDEGPQRLSAERIVFNLDSRTGTLFDAKASFEPSIHMRGKKIEKLDQDTYRLTDGVFTSCDIDNPSWSFHVSHGTVTVNDYAHLQSISFRARKVPVFWTPYIVWPTKRDRSQGLLIPKVGFSNRFGSYVGTAYFLPFGDSADATINADYYSKGYYGAGTTIRYVPSKSVNGRFMGYAVRDPLDNRTQWKYSYQHTQDDLPLGFRGVIDVQDFSDLEFFRFFERDFQLNTISNIYSSAYLTKNTGRYSVNVRTDRREHFLGAGNNQVFEQLPALEFRTYPSRILDSPVYFSMESSASHLRSSLGANYYRADVYPTLSMQVRTVPWLSIKPQVSVRETYYTSSYDSGTGVRTISDQPLTRFYGQGQVEVVGPSFTKIFTAKIGGFDKFKHVIEPRIRYVYTSNVDDQNRVIQFDTVDTPLLPIVRDSVEYSLTQRVIAKGEKDNSSAREILSLSLRQTVSLSKPFDSFSNGTPNASKFTPLTLTAHVNPYQTVSLDANASFGNVSHQIDQASLSGRFVEPKSNSYLNFTWFSAFRAPGAVGGESSQFRFNAGAPLWRDRIRGDIWLNFDANTGQFLEQRYIAGWFSSCYNISFEYRDFLATRGFASPDRNRDYQISINLKNVGTFVDLRGSIN